jgi:hypothetical protein
MWRFHNKFLMRKMAEIGIGSLWHVTQEKKIEWLIRLGSKYKRTFNQRLQRGARLDSTAGLRGE